MYGCAAPVHSSSVSIALGAVAAQSTCSGATSRERHFLYVASPGIRNYVEYGGVGLLVFDMDQGHKFVKRIPTFDVVEGMAPENVKGIAASADTKRLYITTPRRVAAIDLETEKLVWNREYEGGCDRLAISPDGKILYVPSFEGPHWHAVDAMTGDVIADDHDQVRCAQHDLWTGRPQRLPCRVAIAAAFSCRPDNAYRHQNGAVPSAIRFVPSRSTRAQTLCFVNVNELLGFEVGDMTTGKMLHRVEVTGVEKGPVKRHGCPSHGVGLTPDEKELWLTDGANSKMHVFDATVMPPKQISLDQPARSARLDHLQPRRQIRLSIDGRSDRYRIQEDSDHARRRSGPRRAERKGRGDRDVRRQGRADRRSVRHRTAAVAS